MVAASICITPINLNTVTATYYSLPSVDTSFKAYMDYRCITDKESSQWQLQEEATTDEQGMRRYGEDYVIAVGTYYAATCGDRFLVVLEDIAFTAVVGDIKADCHTDEQNMYYPMQDGMGNLVEFIVDTDALSDDAKLLGDVSCLGFEGKIMAMIKLTERSDEK